GERRSRGGDGHIQPRRVHPLRATGPEPGNRNLRGRSEKPCTRHLPSHKPRLGCAARPLPEPKTANRKSPALTRRSSPRAACCVSGGAVSASQLVRSLCAKATAATH